MGAAPSSEAALLRSALAAPLQGAAARELGVIGTLALDVEVESTCCSQYKASPIWCCCGRGEYRVPWPCHCCGAECVCCPHAPKGAAWEAALRGGLDALLREAGQAVARSADQRYAAVGRSGQPVGVPQTVLMANARALLLQDWLPRANALLQGHGLACAGFNWVEDRRDDKGNKTGEVLRSALQFYALPANRVPLVAGEGVPGVVMVGAYGAVAPAPVAGAFYPPPPPPQPQQQQHYQQGPTGSAITGAPKEV